MDRRERLRSARLYFISDARPGGRPLADVLEPALAGGADLFQLRDKDAPDEELLAACAIARELCTRAGALFVVNDRPDIAAQAGADGVHVGQDDASVAQARAVVGPDVLVGLSTHAPEQIDAVPDDADLIGVGPVHATPTKAGRAPAGLALLDYAAAHVRVPWFAIGGLDLETTPEAVAHGTSRIAVVRAIADAPDPAAAARALQELFGVSEPEDPQEAMARGYARGRQRDEAIRATLAPLAPGERTTALKVAVVVAILLAIAIVVGALTTSDLREKGGTVPFGLFLGVVLLVCAWGMWRTRYWAVLAFEAFLWFEVIVSALALVVASSWAAFGVCIVVIGLSGWLAWKLIRVMARIQAYERLPTDTVA